MKTIGAILILGFPAMAQNAQQPVLVQGVALDQITRAPIAGARVVLALISNEPLSPVDIRTDGGGRFALNVPPGRPFTVNVTQKGYEPGQSRQGPPAADAPPIEILLNPLAEIRGRVIDEDTRKPIPGLQLDMMRADTPTYQNANSAVIQEDGSFVAKDLPGGSYFLRFRSKPDPEFQEIPAQDLAGDKREKALEVPEPAESYGILIWPGDNADIPTVPAFPLTGAGADTGEIRLHRYKLHNYSGVLSNCEPGAYLQLLLYQKRGTIRQQIASMDTRCGAGFRLLNVPEGTFTLVAQGGPPRSFTSLTLDQNSRGPFFLNVATIVSVQIVADVDGQPAGTIPDDLKRLDVSFTPESAPVKIDAPDRISPIEYEAHVFGGERYRLRIVPPLAYYVKQISYNGVQVDQSGSLAVVPASLSSMRLLLSNHPGGADVRVSSGAFVYLIRDGSTPDLSVMDEHVFQPAFRGGLIHFAGMAPGKYHAFTADTLSQAALDDGLKHAVDVTIEENQTAAVDLTRP